MGRAFTSRTESYDFTLGLPQLDDEGFPVAPVWTDGPRGEDERDDAQALAWGWRDAAADIVVNRCRFYATLTASDDEEFNTAADDFLDELDVWWTRFTTWVGILTFQDFIAPPRRGNPWDDPDQEAWTTDENGHRVHSRTLMFLPVQNLNPHKALDFGDLTACITASGMQDPPPEEWMFIRDARSLLSAGENRRAILDAGLAAELAMGVLVNKQLDGTNTKDSVKKALRKRYRGLDGKTDLLRLLEEGLVPQRISEER